MKNLKDLIIKYLLLAVYYNDKAHCDWCAKDDKILYYNKKESYYTRALKIIKNTKNSRIKYKIITGPDQNGHMSHILYFNWFEYNLNKNVQVSFHKPLKSNKKYVLEGHKEIYWEGFGGENKIIFNQLKEYYFQKFYDE